MKSTSKLLKISTFTAALAATSLFLSGCSTTAEAESDPSQSAPVAAAGGSITIGLDREIQKIDPTEGLLGQQPILILTNGIYPALMAPVDAGDVEPHMAESFEANEDGSVWTLRIPSDLTFSDGSALTATEIVAHVERLADPNSGSSTAGQAAQIAAMTAPDATTVVFELVQPNAGFSALFARQLGMIASTQASDEFGFPLGAGPFVVDKFSAGDEIVVTPSKHYWGDAPLLESISYQMMPDADSRFQSLKSGEVDIMWTEVTSQFQEARNDSNLAVHAAPAAVSSILLNFSNEQFNDPDIRLALAHAIDRDAINAVVNLGEGVPVDSPFSLLGELAGEADYPEYDVERARELLAGKNVSFSLTVENRTDTVQRATALQSMFADAGVTVDIVPVDSANFGTTLMSGDFDAADFTTSVFSDPAGAGLLFVDGGPYNFTGYANPAVDAAISAGNASTDPSERAEQFQIVTDSLAADLPALWLTASNAGVITGADIAGIPDLSKRTLISINPALLGLGGE
ncbi:ABC transporter substrate-binding protein [Humidisolicoccus flavus]|uniref:ABC transporter substrate-binding protein n=1 Tax=Humidisolicoccus flavus TaxID=3111414 RepID=UPI00324E21F2